MASITGLTLNISVDGARSIAVVRVTGAMRYSPIEQCLQKTCESSFVRLRCAIRGRDVGVNVPKWIGSGPPIDESYLYSSDDNIYIFPTIVAPPADDPSFEFIVELGVSALDEDPPSEMVTVYTGQYFSRYETDPTDEIYARITLTNDLSENVTTYDSATLEGVF